MRKPDSSTALVNISKPASVSTVCQSINAGNDAHGLGCRTCNAMSATSRIASTGSLVTSAHAFAKGFVGKRLESAGDCIEAYACAVDVLSVVAALPLSAPVRRHPKM